MNAIRVIKKSEKDFWQQSIKPRTERQVNRTLQQNITSMIEISLKTIRQNKNQLTFNGLFKQ